LKYELPGGKTHVTSVSKDEKHARRNARLKERDLAKRFFTEKEISKIQRLAFNYKADDKRTELDQTIVAYIKAKSNENDISPKYIEDEFFKTKGCMDYFKKLEGLIATSVSMIRTKHIWNY